MDVREAVGGRVLGGISVRAATIQYYENARRRRRSSRHDADETGATEIKDPGDDPFAGARRDNSEPG